MDKAGDFLAGRPRPIDEHRYEAERVEEEPRRARRGPSDRVLWAVIMERLESDRRVDMRNVQVTVHDAEVTLEGTVRTKEGKRRIEDLVDVDGVRNVQNNLRPRDGDRRWTLF
jgi:osmotically-inducible protein OsmY